MGLKKLFSSSTSSSLPVKNKENSELKNYDKRSNTARSSTLSLTQSISHWTHKDKQKRYSQPSPPASLSQPVVRTNDIRSIPPTQTVISPITPSDSMGDVNDVVNVLRHPTSSEILSINEEYTIPIATKSNNNPFLTTEELYPPNTQDSNKYEVYDQQPVEDATNKATEDTMDDALYSELIQVSLQLETIHPKNAVELKSKLKELNESLVNAANKSKNIHSKLLKVIEISKQTIVSATEKNNELTEIQENLKLELQSSHKEKEESELRAIKEKEESELTKQELMKENQELKQLIMKSENDETKFQSEILASESKYAELMKEKEELLANHMKELEEQHEAHRLELESCTSLLNIEKQEKVGLLNQIEASKQEEETFKEKIKCVQEENDTLKNRVVDIENSSNEAARTVMDENEQLENRIQEIEECKNKEIQLLNNEKDDLSEQIKNLQHRVKELMFDKLKRQSSTNSTREQAQQEELMHMHTKAQLGLIEYLEGEDNVVLAMASLKKLLEERI